MAVDEVSMGWKIAEWLWVPVVSLGGLILKWVKDDIKDLQAGLKMAEGRIPSDFERNELLYQRDRLDNLHSSVDLLRETMNKNHIELLKRLPPAQEG